MIPFLDNVQVALRRLFAVRPGLPSCALIPFFLAGPVLAELPRNNPVPGGVAVVGLDMANAVAPVVRFGERRVMAMKIRENWYAVIGLSSDLAPGNYILTVAGGEQRETTREFRVEPLSASAAQRTMQLPDTLSRLSFAPAIPSDIHKLSGTFWQYQEQPTFEFSPIVDSRLLIPYGLLVNDDLPGRYINHPSVTYFCPADALVYAPAAGVVHSVSVSDRTGIVIYINHGRGMTSVLSHIGETIVKPGQAIESGELIGVVKPILDRLNGRVDWSLILNGDAVDPLQFSASS